MTKQEIERDIKSHIGGACWISKQELAGYLGSDRTSKTVSDALRDIPRFNKKYSIKDVADNIFALSHV